MSTIKLNFPNVDKIVDGFTHEATDHIGFAALTIFDSLTVHRGGREGSPVASGRYVASVSMALNRAVGADVGQQNYKYPSAQIHKYNASNLPAHVVDSNRAYAEGVVKSFKLGQSIHFASDVPYAGMIEDKAWSWQRGPNKKIHGLQRPALFPPRVRTDVPARNRSGCGGAACRKRRSHCRLE